MKPLMGCLFTFALAISAFAQTDLAERQVLVIPWAEHPLIAKESGLGGRVTAYVTVDSAGNVVSVDNVTGPDWVCPSVDRLDVIALREAVRAASRGAKFESIFGQGTSIIYLNFDFPTGNGISEVVSRPDQLSSSKTNAKNGGSVSRKPEARLAVKSGVRFSVSRVPPTNFVTSIDVLRVPNSISGGVMNAKAISLPKPQYPAGAAAVRALGSVGVGILIDENGRVYSAAATSGHPLLRAVSREAACNAEFLPVTLSSGQLVKVHGFITYNFVL